MRETGKSVSPSVTWPWPEGPFCHTIFQAVMKLCLFGLGAGDDGRKAGGMC